ncbi:MAG: hypothetical protein CM15mV127_430 [Caudoviricetes sp.]|nr:MAG: hypothetical protein CM15mV127_430 [Caudoviricetes sp.]
MAIVIDAEVLKRIKWLSRNAKIYYVKKKTLLKKNGVITPVGVF